MRRTWLLSGCMTTLLTWHAGTWAVAAEDAKKTSPAGGVAGETDEALRLVLRDANKVVMAPEKVQVDALELLPAPAHQDLDVDQPRAEALLAIGMAQAMVGDREAARKTWQDAKDCISVLASSEVGSIRVKLLVRLADGQVESGERDEALVTLQEASDAVRLIRLGRGVPFAFFEDSPEARQSAAFCRIAAARAKAGDARAARRSIEGALEAAGAIKDEGSRIDALVEIAKADAPGPGRETWARAADAALSRKDDIWRCKAIEAVLRGLVDSGGEKDALQLVSERLDGDAKAYGIWVVADAMIEQERAIPAEVAGSLADLAERARFDLPSKQLKVLTRVAKVQVKAGDDDGAYRTIGRFVPRAAEQRTGVVEAKYEIMTEIANRLIKDGKRGEARRTLEVTLELLAPFRGEYRWASHRVDEILHLMARAGDSAAALRGAGEIPYATSRADILTKIAVAQAESGERNAAVRTLELARRAIDWIDNEIAWTNLATSLRDPDGEDETEPRTRNTYDIGLKHTAQKDLAVGMAKAGDVPRALGIADALAAEDEYPTLGGINETFEKIAQAQIEAGDFTGAVKTADHIRDPTDSFSGNPKIEMQRKIAAAEAKSGDARGVLAWGTALTRPRARLDVLRAMAEGIVARKRPNTDEAAAANTP